MQEAKLVKRSRYIRGGLQRREVGVVQAFQPHFMTCLVHAWYSVFTTLPQI